MIGSYRVNSKKGTQFRIWATGRLRDYLVEGYAVNRQRSEQNAAELEQSLALIQKTARSTGLGAAEERGLVEIIGRYTQTFLWLQRYDEGLAGGAGRAARQRRSTNRSSSRKQGDCLDRSCKP